MTNTMLEDRRDERSSPVQQRLGNLRRSPALRMTVKRIALAPVILLGVAFAVFVLIDLSPNNPAFASLGLYANAEARTRFAAEHGLDDPLPIRFVRFVGDLLHLDLGSSVIRPEPVGELIGMALPVTLQLLLIATVMSVVIALILGTIAAKTEGRWPDRIISTVATVFQASPPFWIGLLFVQLFAVQLKILPSSGYRSMETGLQYWFSSIIGPSVVLALPFAAAMTRVVRASMAEELSKDYVRTARGLGVPWIKVLTRNVLRNSLVTPVTVLGVYVGAMMSGALLVETVFNIPGMGTLLMTGVTQGDLGVVRGVALVGAAGFVVVNLLVDIAYVLLEPRAAEESG